MISRFKLFFLILLLAGIGSFFFFSSTTKKRNASSFSISEQKPFVFIIPSYNNSKYIEKNLRSVFTQNYENFRVIYIDDASRDDTLEKAHLLINQLDTKNRTSLIHNPINLGALANIYNAAHKCQNHEIIVLLDGDDFLPHENVLKILNQTYANPEIWLTYGNYLDYPSYKQEPRIFKTIPEQVIRTQNFRKAPWVTTHLRTFYAALFKEIKITDLFYRGRFYPMGWDLAIFMPLLEMACHHIRPVQDVLYLYNRENPLNDHNINFAFQNQCQNHVRSKSKYKPLNQLPNPSYSENQTTDLLIFSQDNPLQLYALLESIHQFASGLNKVSVIYESTSTEIETGYLELQIGFPHIQFFKKNESYKDLCNKIIFAPTLPLSEHILLAKDTFVLTSPINFSEEIPILEKTKAYGFYFGHHQDLNFCKQLNRHQPIPPYTPLIGFGKEEIPLAWQFSQGIDDWNCPNSFNFALFRKKDLKKIFFQFNETTIENLEYEWGQIAPQEGVGLYYPSSKFFSLSFPLPKEELLEKFQSGLKIDLSSLRNNHSKIAFIPRE